MKKVFRYLGIAILTLVGLVVLYLAAAGLLSLIPTNPPGHECTASQTIYIADNGVHLDIVVPIVYIEGKIKEQVHTRIDTRYLAFGWGDKAFYVHTPTWNDLTFRTSFNALFLNKPSAMHIGYYRNVLTGWHRLDICPEQLEGILQYIHAYFLQNENGDFVLIEGAGYTPNDQFFDAKGSFWFYRTCNAWVNQALKAGEVRTSVWSPFKYGVLHHLKN